jgi:hypothetical protein
MLNFFDVIISRIVFLNFMSDCLLLVYRTATDFSILILIPATLLKAFIRSNNFFHGVFRVL